MNTLQPGDMIGVFAPSSYVQATDMELSEGVMRQRGYEIFIHPQSYERENQSAGSAAQKAAALHDLYTNPDIKAIWAARGGNRALLLPERLDYDLIRANPKPIIGYSDITALLNPVFAHTGQVGIHGPVFKDLHHIEKEQLDHALARLAGDKPALPMDNAKIIAKGVSQGKLIGGCLSLFHLLAGTDDCPDLNGAILFLEDTGDHMSRFDRMLIHMKRAGVFEDISGLVLGEFTDIQDGANGFGYTLEDSVREMLDGRDIPIVGNAPFGHGRNLYALPVGGTAKLTATDKTPKLEFL